MEQRAATKAHAAPSMDSTRAPEASRSNWVESVPVQVEQVAPRAAGRWAIGSNDSDRYCLFDPGSGIPKPQRSKNPSGPSAPKSTNESTSTRTTSGGRNGEDG